MVGIPPKLSVSEFMSYLKGKSALMFFDRHTELRPKWADRHFWARGYYVATVGNVNEETIRNYIREQEENDRIKGWNKIVIMPSEAASKYSVLANSAMGGTVKCSGAAKLNPI